MALSTETIEAQLKELGQLSDREIPIVKTLLLLGQYERPIIEQSFYDEHIDALHAALEKEIADYPQREGDHVLEYRLARLNVVLRDQFNYTEDEQFGAIDTINLLTVIDRRKGLPVALGSLYMELAARQKWMIHGLNFPGHFILRLDDGAQRLIFDPYYGGKQLDAGGMRHLLKRVVGPDAELDYAYNNTVSSREVILRFYNNKKTRLISDSLYKEALSVTRLMLWVAPQESRLYFEGGVMCVKLGHIKDALNYLDTFIAMSSDKRSISEAKAMMADLSLQLQ